MRESYARRIATAARLSAVALVIAAGIGAGVCSASAATFNPELVISNDNMRDYDSMSVRDIQAFLEAQPGVLKSLVTRDYDKVITLSKKTSNLNITPDTGETPKPASRIIWEACRMWKINPKVMLTMLQKEQSLLTTPPKPGSTTLARAVGAGCPGSLVDPENNPVATNKYPGFGNQIWHGARLLDGYGEGKNGSTVRLYFPGIGYGVYGGTHIHPKNLATYKLYVYNPSIGAKAPYGDLSDQACSGNANFWKIYRRYFGNPFANPRMRAIYRFRNRYNGTYLYTSSPAERYHLAAKHKKKWHLDGAAFSWDSSVTAPASVPMYRFLNKKTHKYSFTTSTTKFAARTSATGKLTWAYGGIAFRVARTSSTGALKVYRFTNRHTGGSFLTSSTRTVAKYRSYPYNLKWRYRGISFYLPRASTATSTTP